MLSTERFRPRNLEEIIAPDSIVRQVREWCQAWRGGEVTKKALLLYGEPGVGKTSMAYAISGEMGWPIVEMNASDQRNRDGVRRVALMASLYRDISGTGTEGLRLILIDEADNFFEGRGRESGGDAGGLSELARVLRVSRNPIVITMNDFYEFRRKGAAREVLENSMVIEFKPYRRKNDLDYRSYRQRLTRRLQQIGEEEGIRLSQDQIQAIMDRNGTDIRGMINDIAGMVASTADVMRRDTKKTPFDVMQSIFKSGNLDVALRSIDESDLEAEDLVMWMDENLHEEAKEPDDLASAYDILSRADVFLGRVSRKQHFAFRMYAQEIAASSAQFIGKRNEHFVKYQFPSYVKKMSDMRESRNTRNSLLMKFRMLCHMGNEAASSSLWILSELRKRKRLWDAIASWLHISDKEEAFLRSQ